MFAMKMKTSFWTYFTSAYGMLWLALLGCSLIAQARLDAGVFGLIGFPIISVIYAWFRRSRNSEEELRQKGIPRSNVSNAELQQKVPVVPPLLPEFLRAHPEFLSLPQRIGDASFQKWLNDQSNR